jgi:hypothetical protein
MEIVRWIKEVAILFNKINNRQIDTKTHVTC